MQCLRTDDMNKKRTIIISSAVGLCLAVFALTAFFAEKKSDEILNKYDSVDSALKAQTSKIQDNSASEKTYSDRNQPKVDLLKVQVDTLCAQIDNLKAKLTDLSEKEQSLDEFLIKKKNADRLKTDVLVFKGFLIKEFQDRTKTHPESKINVDDIEEDGKKIVWENYYFKNVPLASIFSTLDKLKTEIKDAEQDVLRQLN